MRPIIIAILLPITAACSDMNSVVEPATPLLTPVVAAAIDTAIQDEFHAEQTYLRVLADHGAVLPFVNIVVAERQHAAALAGVLERRGFPVPANEWDLDNIPRFTSVPGACAAAAVAEVANIELYDRLLARDLPVDVRTVFSNNRRASLERHLPAFNACR